MTLERPALRSTAQAIALSALALVAAPLRALASTLPAAPMATAAIAPPLDIHARTLANGLKVFTVLDKTTPNVTVQVWYGVGGKNDPESRSGFAHLFEHLMFKATRDMPAEDLDRLTEDVGGENNASTWDDLTEYHEVIPANHLKPLLWAEAERMSSLVVDQADFTSERAVVEEELRQRVLADPYGRLEAYLLPEASFRVHPYKRPVIGSIDDLNAATLADVRAFHATYYRPDNANLIVIGNFDPKTIDADIDANFADIGRPPAPIPRVTAVEPPRRGPRTVVGYGPNAPLAAIYLSFLTPAGSSPDQPALQVADAILSAGKSSRLYRDLVYQQQLAQDANSGDDVRQQPGLFTLNLTMASGKTLDQGEAALRGELARLRDTPIGAEELARAKNLLIAQILRERETVEGRAMALGRAVLIEGDAAHVNSDVPAIQAVTAADVQRVARLYLTDKTRVVVRYLPQTAAAGAIGVPSPSKPSANVGAATPDVAQAPPPPASLPHQPPAPGAAIAPQPPHVFEQTLANGLRVIVAKTSDLPLVTVQLTVRAGSSADPAGLAGLQSLTAAMLPQGSVHMTASAIADAVEGLGGTLSASAGPDGSYLFLTVLADQLNRALPILADVAEHPAFAPGELERLRGQRLDDMRIQMQEPGGVARLALGPVVFGASPYGHPTTGSPSSLSRITPAALKSQYAASFRPDNAILTLTGDIEPELGFSLADQAFGGWARPQGPLSPSVAAAAVSRARVVVIDLPGAGQAAVAVAGPSIAFADPRLYAAQTANAVLGGGYSGRLNEEIRVKRGLSYGAGSHIDARRDTGLFVASAQTKNTSVADVVDLILEQIRTLGLLPVPATELNARKASLVGAFGRDTATSAGLASQLSTYALYGLKLDRLGLFTQSIEAVTPADIPAGAAALIDPATLSLVVVGDAKMFLPALKAKFPKLEVVPASQLDLDRESLTATP